VEDGLHVVRILVVDREGRRTWKDVEYRVDGTEPEFEAWLDSFASAGELVPVEVDPFEPVAGVVAWLPGIDPTPVRLALDPGTGTWRGTLRMPPVFPEEGVVVRIQVRDRARNRHEQDFEILEDGVALEDDIGC
jgi:hypothetical protein